MKQLIAITFLILPISLLAQPNASFSVNSENICAGDTIFFTNTSTNATSFHWFFGDGTDTWIENPFHIYQQNGNYTIKLIAYDNDGNKDSTSLNISVNPSVNVNLINDKNNKRLIAQLSSPANITWFLNNEISQQSDTILYYYESGLYKVVAKNDYGCSDSDSVFININAEETSPSDSLHIIVMNNILTPDIQDGVNDVLFIKDLATYTAPCIVQIYDKYGKLVYLNEKYSNINGFNGTDNKGRKLPQGTYYYIIHSQGRKTATGYIDLIR